MFDCSQEKQIQNRSSSYNWAVQHRPQLIFFRFPHLSSFSGALFTSHTLQGGWLHLVTITFCPVCTCMDAEMAGLQADLFFSRGFYWFLGQCDCCEHSKGNGPTDKEYNKGRDELPSVLLASINTKQLLLHIWGRWDAWADTPDEMCTWNLYLDQELYFDTTTHEMNQLMCHETNSSILITEKKLSDGSVFKCHILKLEVEIETWHSLSIRFHAFPRFLLLWSFSRLHPHWPLICLTLALSSLMLGIWRFNFKWGKDVSHDMVSRATKQLQWSSVSAV